MTYRFHIVITVNTSKPMATIDGYRDGYHRETACIVITKTSLQDATICLESAAKAGLFVEDEDQKIVHWYPPCAILEAVVYDGTEA